jgi:hypothetical protein
MSSGQKTAAPRAYFPAIVCVECDSPIDALVALCIPREEAMDLVAALWPGESSEFACIVATVDGGRSVAALRTPEGRWAACNAFLDKRCESPHQAERELGKLLKRGRRGYVGMLPQAREG